MSSATDILAQLARTVQSAVESVDLEHDLSEVLDNLTVTCNGPGKFNIQIQTQDDTVQPAALHAAVVGDDDDDE